RCKCGLLVSYTVELSPNLIKLSGRQLPIVGFRIPLNCEVPRTPFPVTLWKNNCAILMPGVTAMGTSPQLKSSSVRQAENPGCTPAAVSITRPLRPKLDFPVIY